MSSRGSRCRADGVRSCQTIAYVAIFLGGFIAIGGEWFQMWKSALWNGLDPAFRNSTLAMLTLVLVLVLVLVRSYE